MSEPTQDVRLAIRAAMDALKKGDKAEAQRLAQHATTLEPGSETAWLVLSAALSNPRASREAAQKALAINPQSRRAQEALAWAEKRLAAETAAAQPPENPPPAAEPAVEPAPAVFPADPPPTEETGRTQPLKPEPLKPEPLKPEPLKLKPLKLQPDASAPLPIPVLPAETKLEETPAAPSPQGVNLPRPSIPRERALVFAIAGVAVLLGIVVLVLIALAAPMLSAWLQPPAPTPACAQATLQMGGAQYTLENLAKNGEGLPQIPAGQAATAYWIENTDSSPVFGLSAEGANPGLKSGLKPGEAVKITRADCSTEDYQVERVESGIPPAAALLDQSQPGLRVYVGSGAQGFVVYAARPQAEKPAETPAATLESGAPEPKAEPLDLEVLNSSVTGSGKVLTVSLALTNKSGSAIQLKKEDILLAVENGPVMALLSAAPDLPLELPAGSRTQLTLEFEKPDGNTAIFMLLDLSMKLAY